MSGSTSQPVQTQTQTRDPWSGAQGYLSQMYGTAQAMQQAGTGYIPYTGATVAPLDPNVSTALGYMSGAAGQQQANVVPQLQTIIGQGGLTSGALQGLGTIGTAGQQYQQLYNQNIGAENPYLQQNLDLIQNRIGSAMSGAGRYGSGSYEQAIAAGMAPALMQDYATRMQIAQQATSGLAQTGQTSAQIYQQGLGQIPGLMQAEYLPAQQQLAVGQYYQDRAQQDLQGQIAAYNAQQAWPWQQLERESAIIGGAGQLGGTTVTSQTPVQAPLAQRLLGGALVGGGL